MGEARADGRGDKLWLQKVPTAPVEMPGFPVKAARALAGLGKPVRSGDRCATANAQEDAHNSRRRWPPFSARLQNQGLAFVAKWAESATR